MNKINKSPFLILNQTNALIVNSTKDFKKNILSTFWHKFIIHQGASLDSQQILKSIVEYGGDIFPIQYKIVGKDSTFIARNCLKAIENLCALNLVLKYSKEKPSVYLSIHLNEGAPNETTLNIQNVIMDVLKKRYTKETGVLDMGNFVEDPDLRHKVYCAINQHKVLKFVLSLASGLQVRGLRLNNNELKSIDGLEVMRNCNLGFLFKILYSIDLRNNLISNISELNTLKNFNITELWLDGNPICNAYEDYNYVLNIKEICPNIEKLDDEELFKNGIPVFRTNYLIKYASLNLVDQFLEHYFNLYDTNRESLIDLYHAEALFSLTTSLIPDQITSTTKRLSEFQRINRNLLNRNDSSKSEKWLYHSGEDIVKILCKLSASEHDPYSFTVDVLYHSDETIVISVTGVFRERNDKVDYDSKNLLNFSRTFVLLESSNNEYHIINEQLFISNATTIQVESAFQHFSEVKSKTYTDEEQVCFIETMVKICEIDDDAAKRLLEATKWDLKSSLKTFMEQSVRELMGSSSQPATLDNSQSSILGYESHSTWQNSNQDPNPLARIPNPSFEFPNPIGYPNSIAEISNVSTYPPNEISIPSYGMTYPQIQFTIPPPGITHPPDGIINFPHEISNQFVLPPQSPQISSTNNILIKKLPAKLATRKKTLQERNIAKKRQVSLEKKQKALSAKKQEPAPTAPVKEQQCDICLYFDCHRKDCPKHPKSTLTRSAENQVCDTCFYFACHRTDCPKHSENVARKSSVSPATTSQKENVTLSEKSLEHKDGDDESRKNELPIQKTITNKRKNNRQRCRVCRKRGHPSGSCIGTTDSNHETSININKDGEENKLDDVSKSISSTPDCSEALTKSSQQKNQIVLDLKSNKGSENNDSIEKQSESETNTDVLTTTAKEGPSSQECKDQPNNSICWYCNEESHTLLECSKRKLDLKNGTFDFQKSLKMVQSTLIVTNTSTGPNHKKNFICDYCGHKGHTLNFCNWLKKGISKVLTSRLGKNISIQKNSNGDQILKCDHCGKFGHIIPYCNKIEAEIFKIVVEDKTLKNLHIKTPQGQIVLLCKYCKQGTHLMRNCESLKSYMNTLASKYININPTSGKSRATTAKKNRKMNKLKTKCSYCKKEGHTLNHCIQRKINESVIIINK